MQKYLRSDACVGSVVTLLGIILLAIVIPLGVDVPDYAEMAALAPDFWPRVISILICVTGVGLLISGMKSTKDAPETEPNHQDDAYPFHIQALRFFVAFGLLFMIYFSIDLLGMVLTTLVATLCFLLLGNVRKIPMLLGISVLLPCILYGFFVYVANVPLPIGDLFYAFM